MRTFVRREGHFTPAQKRALAELLPQLGIDPAGPVLDLDALFGRVAPRVLEIGFGSGDALAQIAAEQPEQDFIGIEVHRPGVGRLLNLVAAQNPGNVRVVCGDAVTFLEQRLPAASLDRINIWFPDPWPKKRHHKRRMIQPEFVALLATRLRAGGLLHLATDWQDYAGHMLKVLNSEPAFRNTAEKDYVPRPGQRPLTRFEQRGRRKGHGVWDLLFERV